MKMILLIVVLISSITANAFVPNEAYTFNFNIKMIKMERSKEAKIHSSVELLREIFASSEFKQKILGHKFNGKRQFAYNRGLTNTQIYKKILGGMEKLVPYPNNAMDVEIELYTDLKSIVLGFTRPNTKRIWMNTKYFNRHTRSELASHLTHEWLHKLGFDHEKEKIWSRQYSVPYAIGNIVKKIAKRYR